ncbi:hypothetical protein GCM10022399_08830 [Terrabacter ginsenosidimutans]|uniref:Transposase n=1 Tax=Terrabacter ginsenosidimutans TaxID=490575 RepID=A0ABP7CTT2_9MICO
MVSLPPRGLTADSGSRTRGSWGRLEAALKGQLEDPIAYWNPLVHLTMGGLRWINVPVRLRRWVDRGRPLEESILRTIDARWGRDIELFIEWLGGFGEASSYGVGDARTLGAGSALPAMVRRR